MSESESESESESAVWGEGVEEGLRVLHHKAQNPKGNAPLAFLSTEHGIYQRNYAVNRLRLLLRNAHKAPHSHRRGE